VSSQKLYKVRESFDICAELNTDRSQLQSQHEHKTTKHTKKHETKEKKK
jgi:hypothetical protein